MTVLHRGKNFGKFVASWERATTMKLSCVGMMPVAAMVICANSFTPTAARANSVAFDYGYQMAAYLFCSQSIYNDRRFGDFLVEDGKYDKTKEYNRGVAALKAALKGPHPRKVCFDAARASGWWTDR
ncbi:hypothetical protein [Mesorhizobium sp. M0213]|uniref:hypothetical protein n=1 Tax=Mesorhizobium sp. M0213 TaxID=2956917 RepID=UPI003339C15F